MRSPENEGQRVSGHDESAHPPGAAVAGDPMLQAPRGAPT